MDLAHWLKQSVRRAAPYGIFLVFYAISMSLVSTMPSNFPAGVGIAVGCFVLGSSAAAVYAGWRFATSFSPEPQYRDTVLGYFEVENQLDERELGRQLLTYRLHLREVALSYEKQRQNLTRVAVITALLLISVPIYTWFDILTKFDDRTALPNAWLLVVSSGSTGAIGLAIAVTILRHIKNNQRPLTEIQERMFDAVEAGIAVNASGISLELKVRAIENVLKSLSVLRGRRAEEPKEDGEKEDKDMVISLLSETIKSLAKHP